MIFFTELRIDILVGLLRFLFCLSLRLRNHWSLVLWQAAVPKFYLRDGSDKFHWVPADALAFLLTLEYAFNLLWFASFSCLSSQGWHSKFNPLLPLHLHKRECWVWLYHGLDVFLIQLFTVKRLVLEMLWATIDSHFDECRLNVVLKAFVGHKDKWKGLLMLYTAFLLKFGLNHNWNDLGTCGLLGFFWSVVWLRFT